MNRNKILRHMGWLSYMTYVVFVNKMSSKIVFRMYKIVCSYILYIFMIIMIIIYRMTLHTAGYRLGRYFY